MQKGRLEAEEKQFEYYFWELENKPPSNPIVHLGHGPTRNQ
jgi:hypothetical protein